MKWIAYLSSFLLFQILLIGFFLYFTGRAPEHELSLLIEAVKTGKSAADKTEPTKAEPVPESMPSFQQQLEARALASREIERQIEEAKSLARLAKSRQDAAEAAQKKLARTRQELEEGLDAKQSKFEKEGQEKLLELVTAMKPKLAKDFLLRGSEPDPANPDKKESTQQRKLNERQTLELIKQLDPAVAAKIFKEFKRDNERRKLNEWLAKLGQGEPEVSETKDLKRKSLSGSTP